MHSRFSKKQPVPGLGHIDSSKEDVEGFYDFWYNFDSWRSFEWWDKEVNEGSDRCVSCLFFIYMSWLPLFPCVIAVTISATLRRRINRSVPGEKRRISRNCATLSILPWGNSYLFHYIIGLISYYSLDPRIKRIKQQEKEAREAKKRGTTPGAPQKKTKQQEEEEKKKKEEEAKRLEEEDQVCLNICNNIFGNFWLPCS